MPYYKMNGKRDGLQKYRVVVSFTDSAGEHRQIVRTAYGRDSAIMTEERLRREAEEAPQRMTVAELVERYLAAKKSDVRETTWDRTRRNLASSIIPDLGEVRLDDLTPARLEAWKLSLSPDLAVTTRRNAYRDLGGLLNYAVRMDLMARNPLSKVPNFRDTGERIEKLRYYTAEQFGRFIREAEEDAREREDWRVYVFFCISFFIGTRKGETNALRWSDIDNDIIHVRRSVTQKLRGEDRETLPKNKSSIRDIQAPPVLMGVLEAHRERQRACQGYTDDWRVCGGAEVIRDSTVERYNGLYAAAAGLPHIRIHDFRHSHASVLANEGINVQEIARRLGHSNIQETLRTYSHLYPREEERAVAVLERVSI